MTDDRWHLTLAALMGQPLPPLPSLPRRRCRPLPDGDGVDWHARAWEALEQRTGSGQLSAHQSRRPSISRKGGAPLLTKLTKPPFVGFVGTPHATFQKSAEGFVGFVGTPHATFQKSAEGFVGFVGRGTPTFSERD